MKSKNLLMIILITLFLICFFVFLFSDSKTIPAIDNIKNAITGNSNPKTSSSETLNNNVNQDTNLNQETNSQNSEGGGSNQISEPNSNPENCITKQITYSLSNFNKTSTCNQEQLGICIDKTIDCQIEIHNLETTASGNFKIKLTYFKSKESKDDAIKTKESDFEIPPNDFATSQDFLNLQSTGQDGIANQEISCFFNTVEVPTTQIC